MNSMTGFGRGRASGDGGDVVVELKSVNHRFRDIRFRGSVSLGENEHRIRKTLEKHLKRGTVEVRVAYRASSDRELLLDRDKIRAYLEAFRSLSGDAGVDFVMGGRDFFHPEFMLDTERGEDLPWTSLLDSALTEAIENLKKSRQKEGVTLVGVLREHLENYEHFLDEIKKLEPSFESRVREKMKVRRTDLNSTMRQFRRKTFKES